MGAGLSSAATGGQEAPDFTLDVVFKESISVREVLAAAQVTGKAISDIWDSQVSQRQIILHQQDTPLQRASQGARTVLFNELARIAPHVPFMTRGSYLTPASARGKLTSFWLADPLAGADEAATTRDDLCVSVALVHNGVVVLGVVYAVTSGDAYWAVQGNGAWLTKADGSQHRVECGEFSLSDTGLKVVLPALSKEAEELTGLLGSVELVQTAAGPLGMLKVVSGVAQIYAGFASMYEWDVAAADIIIREAGGAVLQAGACDASGASQEDWKDAVLKEQPLAYNTAELRLPRFVAFGRRRTDTVDENVITSFMNNAFGTRA